MCHRYTLKFIHHMAKFYRFRFQEKAETGACRPAMRRKDQNLALGWSQNSATDGTVIGSPEKR